MDDDDEENDEQEEEKNKTRWKMKVGKFFFIRANRKNNHNYVKCQREKELKQVTFSRDIRRIIKFKYFVCLR